MMFQSNKSLTRSKHFKRRLYFSAAASHLPSFFVRIFSAITENSYRRTTFIDSNKGSSAE